MENTKQILIGNTEKLFRRYFKRNPRIIVDSDYICINLNTDSESKLVYKIGNYKLKGVYSDMNKETTIVYQKIGSKIKNGFGAF